MRVAPRNRACKFREVCEACLNANKHRRYVTCGVRLVLQRCLKGGSTHLDNAADFGRKLFVRKEVSQADRSLLPACPNEYSTCGPPYTGERSFRRPHRDVNVRFSVYFVPPIPDNEHRNEYPLSAVFTAKSADPGWTFWSETGGAAVRASR